MNPLPLTEHTVYQFVAELAGSVAWGTIRSYLSAIRFYQISAGYPDPSFSSFPRLPYLLKGIHRRVPDYKRGKRLPITPELLRKMYGVWSQEPVTFDKIMLWAACCLAFFGFMRAGEFTSPVLGPAQEATLLVGDIRVDSRENPRIMTVFLRHSKTDPFGAGVQLTLGRIKDDVLCPIAAVLGYLAIRPPTPGPLFICSNGTPLSRPLLVQKMREALASAGVETSSYSGHSFRIGAATTAARAGLSDSLIQTLGRWKSSAFTAYIRIPGRDLLPVAATLARQ